VRRAGCHSPVTVAPGVSPETDTEGAGDPAAFRLQIRLQVRTFVRACASRLLVVLPPGRLAWLGKVFALSLQQIGLLVACKERKPPTVEV
jgi:hypothetical protein